jgi:hypothetical protein
MSETGGGWLRQLAYHEAGHAVVGLGCGCTLGYVQIDPDDRTRNVTRWEPSLTPEQWLVTGPAGAAAELLGTGEVHPAGSRNDRSQCRRAAEELGGDRAAQEQRLVDGRREALARVAQSAAAVHQLAAYLVRNRRADHDAVRALL